MVADLHVHSIFSDGSFSPEELIDMAIKKGLKAIALSDHDTVEGLESMIKRGREKGIEVIPAIELSTFSSGSEVHILGYKVDYQDEFFLKEIECLFKLRLSRAKKMIEKLNQLGIKISYQQVKEMAGDKYIGRPHIAKALFNADYIKSIEEAFSQEYIGNGGRAYVAKEALKPKEAIALIHQAGGVAVLAHPYFVNKGNAFTKKEVQDLLAKGLDGIEVYHSKHNRETSNYYLKVAEELGLLITGGSDFHGETYPQVKLGDVRVGEDLLKKLKDA